MCWCGILSILQEKQEVEAVQVVVDKASSSGITGYAGNA